MAELYSEFTTHLAANGVDTKLQLPTLGAMLEYDAKNKQFRHPDTTTQLLANALQKDSYRAPFIVPKNV